jgi:hypothetical protein
MSVKWVGRVRKIGPSNGMSVGSTEAEEPGRVDVAPASRDQTCEWLLERRFARRLRLFLCMCDTHSMVCVGVCMCSKPDQSLLLITLTLTSFIAFCFEPLKEALTRSGTKGALTRSVTKRGTHQKWYYKDYMNGGRSI